MVNARVTEIIAVIGLTEFHVVVTHFKQNWSSMLYECHLSSDPRGLLEQLRSMSYSVGLDFLGNKIGHIEQMLFDGAVSTARSYLGRLQEDFLRGVEELDRVLTESAYANYAQSA